MDRLSARRTWTGCKPLVQHAGRGQGANHWESECGKNLTFSILIHPDNVLAHEQYIISMAVAATMRKYLSQVLSEEVYIKWPNDIYVGDQKVGGILIENRLAGSHIRDCVIGIGLNVNQKEFKSEAPNPVSMLQLEGKEWDREEVLRGIIDLFVWQLEHFSKLQIIFRRISTGIVSGLERSEPRLNAEKSGSRPSMSKEKV